MRVDREVIDGPVSDIPLSLRQYGLLAVAEFSMYFQDLPQFEPKHPKQLSRPLLDSHVGTWVEHPDHQDGYAMTWETRPQQQNPSDFQIDGRLIKVSRDSDGPPHIVGKPKKFEVFSNVTPAVGGERLAQDFSKDELLLIQHIVRKNQKYRKETEVPMDKFVIIALINSRARNPRSRKPRQP